MYFCVNDRYRKNQWLYFLCQIVFLKEKSPELKKTMWFAITGVSIFFLFSTSESMTWIGRCGAFFVCSFLFSCAKIVLFYHLFVSELFRIKVCVFVFPIKNWPTIVLNQDRVSFWWLFPQKHKMRYGSHGQWKNVGWCLVVIKL